MSEDLLVEHSGGVSVITINRPQAKNALNRAVLEGLKAAYAELDASSELSVGILTGAGGSFCAGMDLKAFLAGEFERAPGEDPGGLRPEPPRKPLIAAVEGWALAGGCEMALVCDLIVAAEGAKFGIPEVKRSLVAAGGGLLRLPRVLPRAIAKELALTGDPITAAQAHQYGMVNAVTPDGGALDGAKALAARIAANGPLALAATKQILDEAADWTLAEGWDKQEPILRPVFDSEDAKEGATAFAEKRTPVWKGR
jgi:enoyl-CoA hydratase